MNTADRNVEALDTALRRRFSFQEMPPDYTLLTPERMVWNLFWKYKHISWDKEPYISFEQQLFQFLGVAEDLEREKRAIWEQMKKDGQPMVHQIEWLQSFNYSGYRLDKLLQAINARIEKLIDKDHTIGHSYFLEIHSEAELKRAFKDKVIPLLEEYFFGDYGKIGLVLGGSFVVNDKSENFGFAKFSDYGDNGIKEDLMARPVFKIRSHDEWEIKSIYA